LDEIIVELLAHNYTDEGSGVYCSPIDADNRFYKLIFTRISATSLELNVRDMNNLLLATTAQRAYLTAGSGQAHIFTTPFSFHVDIYNASASAEFLCGGMLDLTPEPQTAHQRHTYVKGTREVTTVSGAQIDYAWMADVAGISSRHRMNSYVSPGGNYYPLFTLNRNINYHPKELMVSVNAALMTYAGRCYQCILVPLIFDYGQILKVPIDGATMGYFMHVWGSGGTFGWGQAFRVG
jgi:hypothetical protein